MTYRAPINDMLLSLNHGAGLQAAVKAGLVLLSETSYRPLCPTLAFDQQGQLHEQRH